MKLKNIILGLTIFSGIFAHAQEETEQERECLRNRFLAGEALKVENYKEASLYYIKGEKICGGYDKDNYNRLIGSLQYTINLEADPTSRSHYVDTLLMFYTKTETLGFYEKSASMLRGLFYLQSSAPDLKLADKYMKEGVDFEGVNVNEVYLQYYYQNIYNLYAYAPAAEKPAIKKRIITEYFTLSKLASDAKMSVETQASLNQFFNDLVKTCNDILPELKEFMKTLPQEKEAKIVTVNNFLKLMDDKGCNTTKEYYMLTDTLLKVDPSVGAFIAKAKMLRSQKKYSDAIATFKDAKNMTTDEAQKDEIDYYIALVQFDMDNYKTAYNTAMSIKGKFKSEALSIAARCVYNTANSCGTSTVDRKCNYYYAEELANRAGDGNTASKARSNFPTTSELFDAGMTAGQSVSLPCWGVSVTIK